MASKKHIVQKGETLESLSKKFYKDSIHAGSLGKLNNIAVQDNVRVGIELTLPPRIVSIGNWEKTEGGRKVQHVIYGNLQEKQKYLFPLPKKYQDKGYNTGERSFGALRGSRAHAGCDLYAPVGTKVYAVADGKVIKYYDFYWQTYALEINHGDFIVRYGEIQPPKEHKYKEDPPDSHICNGIPISFKKDTPITKGQHIAYVGQLRQKNKKTGKRQNFTHTMLHFELYKGDAIGELTNIDNKRFPHLKEQKNFMRRSDLLDPISFLDDTEFIES